MANNNNSTREQERTELYRTLWQIANDLRGSVDGWDFKQYVLGMLFYRFISENLTHYINKHEQKIDPNFDYAKLSDEVAEKGTCRYGKRNEYYESSIINLYPFLRIKDHEYDQRPKILQSTSRYFYWCQN
jgi:type I restriction-modification system DNA methylase subunit